MNLPDAATPDNIFAKLWDLAMSLPVWLRAIVLFAALIVCSWLGYGKYVEKDNPVPANLPQVTNNIILQGNAAVPPSGAPQPVTVARDTQPYIGGHPDPTHPNAANDNPQNIEAAHQAAEYNAANAYHFQHNEDSPKELSIGTDVDADNYVHYRYFQKSDRCVWINRREGGVDHRQWIKDPLNHLHDVDTQVGVSIAQQADTPTLEPWALISSLFAGLVPPALAQTPEMRPDLQPVQGFCVNPHPGNFSFWWGPPIDACNSPMYRQFGDGCVHYQIFNRCANSWDGRIFWTVCHPPPHY